MKNLTHKSKTLYLAIGFGIALLLVYFLAIKKTFILSHDYKAAFKSQQVKANAPGQITELRKKLARLNEQLGYLPAKEKQKQHDPLDIIIGLCHEKGITLKEFPPSYQARQGHSLPLQTTKVIVQGTFINMLKFLDTLEHEQGMGKLTSAEFRSFTDNRTQKRVLELSLYLQTIKNITDNEVL